MDDINGEASDRAQIADAQAPERERARAAATNIFQRLLVTASDTVGLPGQDSSRPTIEQGVRLTREFLRISNQHVRGLVVELVSTIADLTD